MTYPNWICLKCGIKYGRRECGDATWHMGSCDVCGEKDEVTEPRDFGHLKDGWQHHFANAGKMIALEKENAEIKKQLEQTAMALNEQVELNKYLEKKMQIELNDEMVSKLVANDLSDYRDSFLSDLEIIKLTKKGFVYDLDWKIDAREIKKRIDAIEFILEGYKDFI